MSKQVCFFCLSLCALFLTASFTKEPRVIKSEQEVFPSEDKTYVPINVTVDQSDHVYLISHGVQPRIERYHPNATSLTHLPLDDIDRPSDLYVVGSPGDKDYKIYVLDGWRPYPQNPVNSVKVFVTDQKGQFYHSTFKFLSWEGGRQRMELSGIALDQEGRIYISNYTQSEIGVFVPSLENGNQPILKHLGSIPVAYPRGLALDHEGYVYTISEKTVQKIGLFFDQEHLTVSSILSWGAPDSRGNSLFSDPYGIAIDKNRRVYVADRGKKNWQVFDHHGQLIYQEKKQMASPQGIAVDSQGSVYIADHAQERFFKIPRHIHF